MSLRSKVRTITATGGTVSEFFDAEAGLVFALHRFESSDDFKVTSGVGLVEYVIQAGGGGGGGGSAFGNTRGGGAGGVLIGAVTVDETTAVYQVVVGGGGNGGSPGNRGANGGNSSAFGLTAIGGGGGGGSSQGTGNNGGSGGAGSTSGNGTPGQGVTPRNGNSEAGGGRNLTLLFTGRPERFAFGGSGGSRSDNATQQSQVEYGTGGYASVNEGTNQSGGRGGVGVVLIRYPVRRL